MFNVNKIRCIGELYISVLRSIILRNCVVTIFFCSSIIIMIIFFSQIRFKQIIKIRYYSVIKALPGFFLDNAFQTDETATTILTFKNKKKKNE